jgi:hypothetical protein
LSASPTDQKFGVSPYLPRFFEGQEEVFPPDLQGAVILQIGRPVPAQDLEGGGLIIDYLPTGATKPRRLVLAFNECGMWVESLQDG